MKNTPKFGMHLRTLITSLSVGILSVSGATAATTNLWTGATDTSWATPGNWSPSGPPGTADSAIFGPAGTVANASTVNNVVGTSATITGLTYTNTTTAAWHVMQLPSGVILTATGPVVVGGLALGSVTTCVAVVDAGTLAFTGTPFNVGNGNNSSGNRAPGILDLSGLSNFVYNSTSGTLGVATAGSRADGTLTLAAGSNYVTASQINIQGATGTSSSPNFNLGAGTNVINVNTFNAGAQRAATTVQFASTTGGLRLRGTGGTDNDRTAMVVGNRNTGGTGNLTTTGDVLLNGHAVDMKFSTLTLGTMTRSQSGSDTGKYIATGTFKFDQGIVDATAITMGLCSGASTNSYGIGSLTVGAAGTLSAGSISLANVTSTSLGVGGVGTLNVFGGAANCSGDIFKTTIGATGTGIVAVASGTLAVGGSIGSASNPIDNLNLTNATLTLRAGTAAPASVTTLATGGATNIINISTLPALSAYPAQFQLIKYSGTIAGAGFDNNVGLGTLPALDPPFQGYLSNNTTTFTIDVVLTGGPAIPQAITWTGSQGGAWDGSTLNWLAGATPTNYNNAGDFVTFDDAASTSTISLDLPTITPGSITVNNSALTYTFTGSGKLSGSTGLTKQGTGTLILDNSGLNDFAGPVSLTGTLQLGTGGTGGNLPVSAPVSNNGTLVFNRGDDFTARNAISGTGSVVQNGPNTLTLSGNSSFSGALTVNSGVLRLEESPSGTGTGTITANPGGTVVLGAFPRNPNIVLAGGALGVSARVSPPITGAGTLTNDLTAATGTFSTLYFADPQRLTLPDGIEMAWSNTLHGSGTILVATVLNDTGGADNGSGFRLRGTNPSDFTGTLILSNMVKGEIQTVVAGPFSPAGTGKIVMWGGTLTPNTVAGTYSELNLRNNSAGSTVFGNDVEIAGTGLVLLDPLGTAPTASTYTMGNLKIGAGQELGIILNGTATPAVNHPVVFPTVSLNGGNASFSPKTPGWNTAPQWGSDLVLGNISELAGGSGFTMTGLNTLWLTGDAANTYTGPTINANGSMVLSKTSGNAIPGLLAINAGTVTLSGNDQIADPAPVLVNGGTLSISTNNDSVGPVTLVAGSITGTSGTLTASSYDVQSGSISANLGGAGALTKTTGGTVTLSGANTYAGGTTVGAGTLKVNNTAGSATGSGSVTVAAGATLSGSGSLSGAVTVAGTVSPGSSAGLLATGPQTWNAGGTFVCEVIDAANVAGTGFDALNVAGGIDLQATSGNPFGIQLLSLNGGGAAGSVTNFNNNTSYAWKIAALTESITNFDTAKLALNVNSFSNDLAGGFFFLTEAAGLNLEFTNNHAPVAAAMSITAPSGTVLNIPLTAVATNWSDADADPVTLVSVAATSTNGAPVGNDGTTITYTVGSGPDAITYTVRDQRSTYRTGDTVRSANGIIVVSTPAIISTTNNVVGFGPLADGNFKMTFAGTPGVSYAVQMATSLATPINWQNVYTNLVDPTGIWTYEDLTATNSPERFYRAKALNQP